MQPCVLQFSEEGQSRRLSVVAHRCVLVPTLLEELEDAASLNQPRIRYLGKTSSCLILSYIYIPHHLAPGLWSGACKLRCLEETGRYREERSKPKWDLCALQTGGTVLHPNLAAYTQIQSIDII